MLYFHQHETKFHVKNLKIIVIYFLLWQSGVTLYVCHMTYFCTVLTGMQVGLQLPFALSLFQKVTVCGCGLWYSAHKQVAIRKGHPVSFLSLNKSVDNFEAIIHFSIHLDSLTFNALIRLNYWLNNPVSLFPR